MIEDCWNECQRMHHKRAAKKHTKSLYELWEFHVRLDVENNDRSRRSELMMGLIHYGAPQFEMCNIADNSEPYTAVIQQIN